MGNANPSPVATAVCAACGRPLPRNAPGGLCPPCLMGQGVRIITSTRAKPGGFAPPAAEEMGLLFPDFDQFEWIGQGGMGAVYRALQSELDRTVAIKILPPETAVDPEFTERFRREAATLARLDHPNIVKLFDYGQREGFAYFVMEFVDGVDLARRIADGPLPLGEAFTIISQLCDALEHSHARGVVHRDIKPANILLARGGCVKVADFGVARLVHANGADEQLTRTRSTLGTPRYMAPEQMTPAGNIDHRADIYAAGVVLYEMLTGVAPGGSFDPPSEKMAALNPRIDEVVLRALSNERDRRQSSATELKTGLRQAIEKPAPTRRERVRALAVQAFAVSAAAAVLGASGAFYWSWRNTKRAGANGNTQETAAMIAPVAGKLVELSGASPIPLAGERATAVTISAARDEFGLLLTPEGKVLAWGGNRFGQTNVPAGLNHVIAIAAGQGTRSAHALALRADGTVMGWGDNTFKQARPPTNLTQVTSIAAGELHSLALTQDGHVVAWGNPASAAVAVPADLPPVQAIAAGADFSVALLKDGSVKTWGANDAGQGGIPKFPARVVEIACGARHCVARLADGRVMAWGNNSNKQCDVPAKLPPITRVFAGGEASAAVDAAGRFYTWGKIPEKLLRSPGSIKDLAIGSTTWAALVVDEGPKSK